MMLLQTTTLRQVVGKFLYYAHAVDPTMLETLNELAMAQTNGTQATATFLKLLCHTSAGHHQIPRL
jgi:hypothetical protein